MKKYYVNTKGYTLIELIVVLSILGIVMSSVYAFLTTNIKSFSRADNQMEVQYQAQIVMDRLADHAMEAARVFTHGEVIVFERIEGMGKKKYILYRLNGTEKRLYITESNLLTAEPTTLLADYISNINIIPTSGNAGIEITVTTHKNGATISLENTIYFRNNTNP
ncbi:type II secretion system protein J [Anaerosolibacter sp.]|uniref:type II secretion system protein J n=1 Tax=Anaerosolibacter sp. TaxID=1872527 RepID=UPI0039EF8D6F